MIRLPFVVRMPVPLGWDVGFGINAMVVCRCVGSSLPWSVSASAVLSTNRNFRALARCARMRVSHDGDVRFGLHPMVACGSASSFDRVSVCGLQYES